MPCDSSSIRSTSCSAHSSSDLLQAGMCYSRILWMLNPFTFSCVETMRGGGPSLHFHKCILGWSVTVGDSQFPLNSFSQLSVLSEKCVFCYLQSFSAQQYISNFFTSDTSWVNAEAVLEQHVSPSLLPVTECVCSCFVNTILRLPNDLPLKNYLATSDEKLLLILCDCALQDFRISAVLTRSDP